MANNNHEEKIEKTEDDTEVVSFEIIIHSGQARTIIHEGFKLMREGNYEEADKKLDEANEEILQAHRAQTKLLQDFAAGKEVDMNVIMVHAQDHLMTTIALREVAVEMNVLYQKVGKLESE
ncbi:MAG: PTS cellobiose transporter subunit IIA [Miniphocaeibacter sp.]|uniref:PTS cellobiose transporter subunit IIA n=1 Tax=Miniphocaeibacter sp. TaxID=3100973 RepID=UPI0017EA9D68|nr:PTS cellobiose transporter subunit IIA [Gallicola sp.]